MKLQDILNIDAGDLAHLTKKELTKINNYLRQVTRSRLKSLHNYEKAYNFESPALKTWKEGEGFKIGQNLNEKRNEFVKLRKFLSYKTSTVSGIEEYRQNIENKVGEENANDPQFWNYYAEFKKYIFEAMGYIPSDIILQAFTEAVNSNPPNKETLFERAESILKGAWGQYTEDIRDDFWDFEDDNYNDIFGDF